MMMWQIFQTSSVKTALKALTRGTAFAGLVGVALTTALPAAAADPKKLGDFNAWTAYVYGTGGERICYVVAAPTRMQPSGANRGDVFVMVTHRPGQNIRNEVSTRAGYVYSDKSRPFVSIGDKKYQLFTGAAQGGEPGHWAWLEQTGDESRMVNAMKAGSRMVIKGTSKRGTLTTDTYSLSGITAAMNKIGEACK